MNKLVIEQNSNSRSISSQIIEELYKNAKTLTDDNISLKGSLTVQRAYKESVTYLNTRFPDLNITVTSGYFVPFKDEEVKRICVENWGSDGGCTPSSLQNISLGNNQQYFRLNDNIEIMDLAAFKNINNIYCSRCWNVKEIYLGKVTSIGETNTFLGIGGDGGYNLDKFIIGEASYVQGSAFNKSNNTVGVLAVKNLSIDSTWHGNFIRRLNITDFYIGGETHKFNAPSSVNNPGTITNLHVPQSMKTHYESLQTSINTTAGRTVIVNVVAYDFDTDPDGIFDGLNLDTEL